MFKVGDKVILRNGSSFSNGEKIATVSDAYVSAISQRYQVWLQETGTWVFGTTIQHLNSPPNKSSYQKGTLVFLDQDDIEVDRKEVLIEYETQRTVKGWKILS